MTGIDVTMFTQWSDRWWWR